MMKKRLLISSLIFITSIAFGQNTVIPLYPDGVPNAKATPPGYVEVSDDQHRVSKVSIPQLIPFLPEGNVNQGAAVIICPGGAYRLLSMDLEGEEVAKAFARQGIAAFVLKYRLPSDEIMQDKQIGPLQDVQRALMIVRQRAKEFQIDTSKVGVMGFSAGGHLASTAGTHFRTSVISNPEHINLRPDFLMLIYPVITMGKYTHPGSRLQLLGKTPSAEQVNGYSNELQITADTPPAFIVQAGDDRAVPVQNSLMFYAGLLEKKIPAALHLYPAGGHGFGLHNKLVKEEWFNSGLAFLNYLKIIH